MRAGELNLWWRLGAAITMPLVRAAFRVRVEGLEHVPATGPAILAFNHVSALDGPVLAIEVAWRHRRRTRFLVAVEFFRRPLIGGILRRFEQIPIRRGASDDDALDEATTTVRRGALGAIAPEGSVNADGAVELQRVRSGVARIAVPTGAPIVPVGIWGTQRRWPRSGLAFRAPWRPAVALAFGSPLLAPADATDAAAAVDDVTARLRDRLITQVARARAIAAE
ncbi:MAG TPA: lysophospholipid acyltransferase family protein [Actinomycetota bacterium]|nr:lysophospholipid acyltransferase family protein [Actinomycetota bacterium]